jgi:hypothetical protein
VKRPAARSAVAETKRRPISPRAENDFKLAALRDEIDFASDPVTTAEDGVAFDHELLAAIETDRTAKLVDATRLVEAIESMPTNEAAAMLLGLRDAVFEAGRVRGRKEREIEQQAYATPNESPTKEEKRDSKDFDLLLDVKFDGIEEVAKQRNSKSDSLADTVQRHRRKHGLSRPPGRPKK